MSINYENFAHKILEIIESHRMIKNAPVDIYGCKSIGKSNKLKIFIAILLSSQTRDEVTANAVNILEKNLENGLTLQGICDTPVEEINRLIKSVGFHNKKSMYLKKIAEKCLEKGIPDNLEGLMNLPGVGEKMAYLYLQHAENKVLGISVDTHVHRVSNRIGLVKTKSTEKTRLELEKIFDKEYWGNINHLLVGFGQMVCKPVKPNCKECNVKVYCKFYNKW